MTKDEAARHKHWILLHAGGTPLQVWSKRDLCWYDSPNPSFRLNCIYRVKPTPTPEEESYEAFKAQTGFTKEMDKSLSFNVVWEAARKYYQAAKGI